MTIRALHILPPLAIGRLGGAAEPVVSYTLEDDQTDPLAFRRIIAQETFVVDVNTGEIASSYVPDRIEFRDGDAIRPVAPFLELFAELDDGTLVPVTIELLRAYGLAPADVQWRGRFANRKVVRRTTDERDAVVAETPWFSDHTLQPLIGHSENFVADGQIPFGTLRYVQPTDAFPALRLRFTPAAGLIYGPALPDDVQMDPSLYRVPEARRIYNTVGTSWYGYMVPVDVDDDDAPDPTDGATFVNETLPASLFAIDLPAPPWLHGNIAKSRGYFDDACDGIVDVRLTLPDGVRLEASARVTSGPPAIVPDALFIRSLSDDLDQALLGPRVSSTEPDALIRARAEEIVRRSHETVRFLNVSVMNGNVVRGRPPLSIDTMPAEEAYDTDRLERPVMSEASVDTLAVMALHQQVYAALRSGVAPWFVRLLRRPEDAADYTDAGRRRMPALMCGADNNYLSLTHRQIDTIRAAAETPLFAPPLAEGVPIEAGVTATPLAAGLTPRNLSAQLHHVARGNPYSAQIENAVANCTPGLEIDMRAVWRRMFEGIVLREYDNLVVDVDPGVTDPAILALEGRRLMRVAEIPMVTTMVGPSPASPDDSVVLSTEGNPHAVAPLEWSNALAKVLADHTGDLVRCDFSAEPVWLLQVPLEPESRADRYHTVELRVRPFFEPGTVMISEARAKPGELTQGLCSPWQNDYRECSCYYWASARPDYVNVEVGPNGASRGDNWLQHERTGDYVPDDYEDSRLILYDDLFARWETLLRFQIGGRDLTGDGAASQ